VKKGEICIEFAKLKMSQVLLKNPGYSKMKTIYGILSKEINDEIEGIIELLQEEISCFKYVLIVFCDVKKNFSE
jgi:hypothetical protein